MYLKMANIQLVKKNYIFCSVDKIFFFSLVTQICIKTEFTGSLPTDRLASACESLGLFVRV